MINIGDKIADGKATWRIGKNLSMNGGTMAGDLIVPGPVKLQGKNYLNLVGGDSLHVATVHLFDSKDSMVSGQIHMYAWGEDDGEDEQKHDNHYSLLVMRPDGDLLHVVRNTNYAMEEHDLAGSAIVAKSFEENGYIKYASGLLIQWGAVYAQADTVDYEITYPIVFKKALPFVTAYPLTNSNIYTNTTWSTAQTARIRCSAVPTDRLTWLAIGY